MVLSGLFSNLPPEAQKALENWVSEDPDELDEAS
jgi:hypothetical protein